MELGAVLKRAWHEHLARSVSISIDPVQSRCTAADTAAGTAVLVRLRKRFVEAVVLDYVEGSTLSPLGRSLWGDLRSCGNISCELPKRGKAVTSLSTDVILNKVSQATRDECEV